MFWRRRKREAEAIRFIGDLERLRPQKGDRFVLHFDGNLADEDLPRLLEAWEAFWGDGDAEHLKLLVVDRRMRLELVNLQTK